MERTIPEDVSNERRLIIFGLLAGPILWTAHFLFGYGLVQFLCPVGQGDFRILGFNGVQALIVGATLAALALLLLVVWRALGLWRRATQEAQSDEREEEPLVWLSLGAVVLGGLFGAGILFSSIPALLFPPCR